MSLRLNRHFIAFLFGYLALISVKAQTLYWVGGSGNFNDPKHWSLSSGGSFANQVPNSTNDVVFDDNSGKGIVSVVFGSYNQVKGFFTQNSSNLIRFSGQAATVLNLKGSFGLSKRTNFKANTSLVFSTTSNELNQIDFGSTVLSADVSINEGFYNIVTLSLDDSHTLKFGAGNYSFTNAVITAGNIINDDANAKMDVTNSFFKTTGKFKIAEGARVNPDGMYFTGDLNSPLNYSIPSSLGSSGKYSSNSINVVCPVTISLSPSCNGPCTGVLTVSLSPTCTNTPYSVVLTNTACAASAAAMSNTNIPNVYTYTNACQCSANYILVVRDGSNTLQAATNTVNFNPNSALIFDSNTSPQCSYSCDGTLQGSIIGSPPFSVTVVGSGTATIPSFTTASGDYTITNMCAGTYTFNVTDAGGCLTPIVNTLLGPATLSANPVTTSITCNGFTDGAFAISPTGGTANYTVNFSNSSTFTTSGSAVSATGLGVGAISATITDANSCTLTASSTINQPAQALSVTITPVNPMCFGACTGSVTSNVSGGTAPYTYSWSVNTSTNSSVTSLCASSPAIQTLTVKDFNNCSNLTQTFVISEPPAISVPFTQTNVVCSGSCTGVVSFTPTGGTGAITFTWVAPGPSTLIGNGSSQSSLCSFPGAYTITAADANQCAIAPVLVSITQPTPITVSVVSESVDCFGATTGGATVTASGGNSSSYSYSWTPPGALTASVITLGAGTYSLVVFDASLCPATQTIITITQPTAVLSAAATQTDLTCNVINAACDGIINVIPNGGTPAYSYTMAGPTSTVTTAPPYTNLCANVYTVLVRDASSCTLAPITVTLQQPGPLLPVITIATPIACAGTSVGVLTGTASGGTSPYTYTWTTPAPSSVTGATLSGVPGSTVPYTLTVSDSRNCTSATNTILTDPPSMTLTVPNSTITCNAACNGSFASTVSGGSAPYSYAWTNSLSATIGTNSSISSLCPGQYTLTVTDLGGCTTTIGATVFAPPLLVLTQTSTPVNCFGDSNGSATITAVGGTTPYVNYNFVSPTNTINNATGIISGQPSATFVVSVTDNAGCTQTISTAITSPTALAAVISGTGSCNVCNGTATITPSFGTAPYSYLWTSQSGTFATTPTVASLCTGNYTATVTDSKGCLVTGTISITQIVTVTITPGATGILCNGALTGSATANQPTGGTPGYSFFWTPSAQTTSVITGVGAGTYTVQVTDSSLPPCSNTATITITQPPPLTVTATQTNVTCFGFTNGAINSTVTGGTAGYTYSWSPGSQTTPAISSLSAGSYTLRVRDANLCLSTQNFSITQSSSISITHTAVNPSGCSFPTGSICTTASGGSGSGYTYTWSPPGGNSNCLSGLNGGTYQHTVTDGAGCSNTISVTLFNATGPTLTAVSSSISCFGASTGGATVTAAGVAPFTFTWSPSATSATITNGTTGSGLSSGVYVVSCSDANGCVTNTSIAIVQSPSVTLNPSLTPASCNGLCNGAIVVAPTQGTLSSPSFTFSWLPVSPPITGQGTRTVTNLCSNTYTLNLTDGNNCSTQYSFAITQPPAFTVSAVTSSLLCNNVCTGSIVANATGGTGSLNYSWTPIGGNTQTVTNLCATGGTNAASYTLTITDAQSCTATANYTIAQPPLLTNTVNVINATCSNSCNAIASQTAGGGVGGYNYSWSSSSVTTTSLGAHCAGTYTAFVTDANGCLGSSIYTVGPPAPLNLTLTPSNPLCNAACNGSINTLVSGAQGTVSYSWLPAGSGQNPTGLCATPNPVYTVVATDQNSCSVTSVVTLTNPPLMVATVSGTNPTCNNFTNGSASVAVSNAVGATSYTWALTGPPVQTTQIATGLASGPYTVIVRDANNCQVSQTFTLANPPALVVNVSLNPATCSQSNGAMSANPSGGTPGSPIPYTYTWTGVVSSASVVTGVPAGAYTVAVSDGLACTTTVNVLLSNSNGPSTMPVISSSLLCNAQCAGTASVDIANIAGGTSPYTASWIAPAPSTVNPLSNLCAGSYTAQIVDATGCIGFTTATIAEPPPIVNAPNIGLPLCPGICSGSIGLNTTGGNAPYTFSWIPASLSGSVLTNLCAGDYTLIVGYNSVCADTSVISLPDQSSLTITPSATNNICFGSCNGAVTLSVSGGTSPYTAGWNTSQTGMSLSNLCNANYTVIVTDNNGCSDTAAVAITSNPQITSTTSASSPSCGVCDGAVSVTASGGTAPFTYVWSNSATTSSISNLCAGIYQVIVSDALSCSQSHTVILNNSNGITGENIAIDDIPCSGACVGAATVTAIGGTPPIAYNWGTPSGTTSVINNLCPGTYFVQMSDLVGCIRSASVTIDPLVTLTVSSFVHLPACGTTDGSISIVISGGTPSYNIAWSPSVSVITTSLTNLVSGVYSYTVTESGTNSCSVSQTINISNSDGPVIIPLQSNIDCFGSCTGSISTSVTSTNVPLTYAWSNGSITPNVANLCKGVVTLTVTDAAACVAIQSFTLTDNPQLQLGVSNVQNPSCFGDCDGSINLVPSGGVLPYSYTWTVENATSNPIISLCDGSYSATVTDALGCPVSSPLYTIKSVSDMSLAINSSSSSCSSVADASINVVPSGGIAAYLFNWQGPYGYTASVQNISNVFSGSYTVSVTDNLGCGKAGTVSISSSITVVANAGPDAIICPETGSVTLNASGSSTNTSYKWFSVNDSVNAVSNGPLLLVSNITEPAAFVLKSISAVPACFDRDTINVGVYNLPAVDAGRDFLVPVHSTVTLGGYPSTWSPVTLTWSPAMYLNDVSSPNPIATNTVDVTFTLTVTDDNGCIAMDSVHVFLFPELKISSGFTPNGDGKNDLWIIDYIEQFPATTVEIFNRWGDEVFSSAGYQTAFDGKYKGNDLPVGTYYYVIKLNHPGYPKPITGPLTIFR